jgi:hypothetical protein
MHALHGAKEIFLDIRAQKQGSKKKLIQINRERIDEAAQLKKPT